MRNTKCFRATLTCVAIMVTTVAAWSFAAGAHAETTTSTADWEGNSACAVISATDVRCFGTEAAMERATSPRALGETTTTTDTVASAAAGYCAGRSDLWLYLYEFSGYGGRVLKFRDIGYWQNLSTWGFSDQMSSWRNDTYCSVYAADGANGAGSWLTLAARSSSTYVGGTWDNRVSSIFITG